MTDIDGSSVLIFGGTGSFGQIAAARMVELNANITIYSRDEMKQSQMKRSFPDYRYIIGDVRDQNRVRDAMKGIDIVFNAAALKQVPSCEECPEEAIKTNINGTINICRAAVDNNVKTVVGLSTDKAVKPINAMGMSKALMEKIICSFDRRNTSTIFCCTRYGNVMGSRGSVIPLFKQQIEQGGPVTITVPEMTRFLLTLDKAIDLVLYAVENSTGSEIFVKKAPACRVDFLARSMIKKYGNGRDVSITTTGTRAGEKLHETLINEYEMLFTEDRGDYFIINNTFGNNIIKEETIETKYAEYTSANTVQIENYKEISGLLYSI